MVEPHHQVVHLKAKFAADAKDETWMLELAKEENWVIVSGDLRIRKNPHEIVAWRSAGHTIFFLKPGWINLPFWTQMWKFVKCFPDIVRTAERAKKGGAFYVSVTGKVEK